MRNVFARSRWRHSSVYFVWWNIGLFAIGFWCWSYIDIIKIIDIYIYIYWMYRYLLIRCKCNITQINYSKRPQRFWINGKSESVLVETGFIRTCLNVQFVYECLGPHPSTNAQGKISLLLSIMFTAVINNHNVKTW